METHVLHLHPSHAPWWQSPRIASLFGVLLLVLSLLVGWLLYLPSDQIARGVVIESHEVSRFTIAQASLVLSQKPVPEINVQVIRNEEPGKGSWATTSAQLGLHWHVEPALEEAQSIGRRGSFPQQAWERISGFWITRTIALPVIYDDVAIDQWLSSIDQEVSVVGQDPQASIVAGNITINPGAYGHRLDRVSLKSDLLAQAGKETLIEVPIEVTHIPLTPDGVTHAQKRLEQLRAVSLELIPSEREAPLVLTPAQYFPWLQLPDGYRTTQFQSGLDQLTKKWTRSPKNAEFAFESATNKVTTFVPHETGRGVELETLTATVVSRVQAKLNQPNDTEWSPRIEVPFTETQPEKTLESTNSLGIKELIGYGTSQFKGSIPGRIHNVALTSNRVSLTLVPAGQEFSFNAALGEVSRATGFQQAYVIRNGRTELGDGGGVCQVSTTIFRAALNAGLPISQWKAHSYRVGYYEQGSQPGFDATVYSPSVDLKFRNDTAHAILLRAVADVENTFLTVEVWGTSDGRQSVISDYKMWNQRPAPATLYQDDPSLPRGVRRQVDWSAPGASTSFHYQVTNADGSLRLERDFVSHFKPWQAVFLVGTGG